MDKDENVETGRLNHKRKKKSKKENEKEKMRERKKKKVFDLVGKIKLQIFDLLFIFGWRIKSFFQSTIFHLRNNFQLFLSSITHPTTALGRAGEKIATATKLQRYFRDL